MKHLNLEALLAGIKTLAQERNLPEEKIIEAIEHSLAAAWRRDNGERGMKITSNINLNTGELKIYKELDVVKDVEDELTQISTADAFRMNKNNREGDILKIEQKVPESFGRVAAQTAKQAILHSLRSSESEIMMAEYENRVGTLITATVARIESRFIKVDLGRANAIMPKSEQVPSERYTIGERLKLYIKAIEREEGRSPQMIVSRACPEFVNALFKQECPELEDGAVTIVKSARVPGLRTKLLVTTAVPGVDPAGTLIGGRGVRVKSVNSELGENEKIDIIDARQNTDEDLIRVCLAPAQIDKIILDKTEKSAKIVVSEEQQRIAIGRAGSNVRLASELTGYELTIEVEAPQEEAPAKKKVSAEDSLLSAISEAPATE